MKKLSILLGLMIFPVFTFAGGYGLINPIKIESSSATETSVSEREISPQSLKTFYCRDFRTSRWYECDTKSEITSRRSISLRSSERFSDSLSPTIDNRFTRGQDIEREFDRQAAARNKLLRYRRAYSK